MLSFHDPAVVYLIFIFNNTARASTTNNKINKIIKLVNAIGDRAYFNTHCIHPHTPIYTCVRALRTRNIIYLQVCVYTNRSGFAMNMVSIWKFTTR